MSISSSLRILTILPFVLIPSLIHAQNIQDDFEGNSSISNWTGDDCGINTAFANPFKQGINNSNTVLQYRDTGGSFANVRFDLSQNIDLSQNHTFSLKIYVPSSDITGSQANQVSLKLQDGNLAQPWSTQTEIIQVIELDKWQVVTFNFRDGTFKNLNAGSPNPVLRSDFNRVLIQINGENNNDHVTAYIDDLLADNSRDTTVLGDGTFNRLVWSDEFNGSGAIDTSKWFHQTLLPNGQSWFNGEVQHYTDRTDNSYQANGNLHIMAKKEQFTDQGVTKNYSSARLNSKFAFTYGRVEARAKLPTSFGTWPAIWMLGKNIDENGAYWQPRFGSVGWPDCGEIDIMEHWGSNPNYVQSAMHTPSSHGGTVNKGGIALNDVKNEFHVYSVDWYKDRMVFQVDSIEIYTYKPSVRNMATWPFFEDQFILLNVAIEAQISQGFNQEAMIIDYVRVYQSDTLGTINETKEPKSSGIRLFPNPSQGHVYVQGIEEPISLSVFTLTGAIVHQETATAFDLNHLAAGIYWCEIRTKSTTSRKRLVIH